MTYSDWSIPAELNTSPPREVRYRAVGILAIAAALAVAIGSVVLAWYLSNQSAERTATAQLLAAQGTETTGTVTRLWRSGGRNTSFLVGYEFEAAGRVFHGEARAPRPFWERLREGQRIGVRYVPADPLTSVPAGVEPAATPAWVPVFVPLMSVGSAVFLVFKLRRLRALLEDGRAAPGVITRSRRIKHGRHVRYDFLLPDGSTATGSGTVRHGNTDPGAVITIVYDPENPRRSAPYPLEQVAIVR